MEGQSTVYQRLWNPTVARFESGVAVLEGAPESVAFATGMAALSAVLLAAVAAGKKHVVAVRPLYGGTRLPARLRSAWQRGHLYDAGGRAGGAPSGHRAW